MKQVMSKLEDRLLELIPETNLLTESMRYSLFPGGKRIRPYLYFLFRKLFDDLKDEDYTFAAAIEMIHTYSLIHDDLPAMDNDDMRRGKASNHKVYGEAGAILAGDALLNRAYEVLFNLCRTHPEYLEASFYLASSSGLEGMILGQVQDMSLEGKEPTLKEMEEMISLKTGKLLGASIVCAGLVSGEKTSLENFAMKLGKAFQIQDDILDVTGSQEKLGKSIGKDEESSKSNYVTSYGLEKATEILNGLVKELKEEVSLFSKYGDTGEIVETIDFVKGRNY